MFMKKHFAMPLVISMLAASCVTQKKCNQKFPPTTVSEYLEKVVVRDTIIPGALVIDTILLNDTLVIRELRTNVRVVRDTANNVELRIWIDKYNQLQATCEALEKKIQITETHKTTNTHERVIEPPSKLLKHLPWLLFALAFAALVYVAASQIRR
jgi:hypothetical protein